MNTARLADLAGVTTRQLTYWTTKGYLHLRECAYLASGRVGCECAHGGSGNVHDYPDHEVRVAVRMGALLQATVSPEYAGKVARAMVDHHLDRCAVLDSDTTPILELTYLPPPVEPPVVVLL